MATTQIDPLRTALDQALGFAAAHRGHIADYDAAALRAALDELDDVQDALVDAEPLAAQVPDAEEWLAEVEALTLFLDREWEALPHQHAERLLADPQLAGHAHFLRIARRTPAERPTLAEELRLADQAISRTVDRILAGSPVWT